MLRWLSLVLTEKDIYISLINKALNNKKLII